MTTVTIRPDADTSTGSWTNEAGGSTLYASIDESVASDTDYIRSSVNPIADVCKISLGNPSGTLTTPVTVVYRYKKEAPNTTVMALKVRLLQGTTEIAFWTDSAVSATFTDGSQTLTAPQLAAITDQTDLYLEFTANPGPANLITNGDFSDGTTGWTGWYYNGSIVVVDASVMSIVSGRMRTSLSTGKHFSRAIQGISGLSIGATYNLSVDYFGDGTIDLTILVSTGADGEPASRISEQVINGNTSGTYTTSFTATATTHYIGLLCQSSYTGVASHSDFDNVSVTAA